MTSPTAPAAMPSLEDVALAIYQALHTDNNNSVCYVGGLADGTVLIDGDVDLTGAARAAFALFAPILAEKEREIERLRAGWDKARTSAKYWGGLYTDLDDKTRGYEARALAAEAAARAEERERCAQTGYRVCAETRHVTLGDKVATAIRAQGE